MACFRDHSPIKHRQKPSKTQAMTMPMRALAATLEGRGFKASRAGEHRAPVSVLGTDRVGTTRLPPLREGRGSGSFCVSGSFRGGASRAESDSSTRADGSGNRRCFRSSPVPRPTSRFRPPPTTSIPPGRGHLDDIDSASHRLTHLRTASPRTSAVGSACTWSGPPARLSARARGTVPGAREGAGSCRPDRCAAPTHVRCARARHGPGNRDAAASPLIPVPVVFGNVLRRSQLRTTLGTG